MNQEQLRETKRWASSLERSSSDAETRAAARAILRLAAEVERLRAEGGRAAPLDPPDAAGSSRRPAHSRLFPARDVLRRSRRGRGVPAEDPDAPPSAAAEDVTAAPEALEEPSSPREAVERDEDGTTTLATVTPRPRPPRRAPAKVAQPRLRRLVVRPPPRAAGVLAGVVLIGLLAVGAFSAAARIGKPDLDAHGPSSSRIGAPRLHELVFWARGGPKTLRRAHWRLDGRDVTARARLAGDRQVVDASGLSDGTHTLSVSAGGGFLGSKSTHSWTFAIDTRGPLLRVPHPEAHRDEPVKVAGRVESGASVAVDGAPLQVRDGRFSFSYARLPKHPLRLVATDPFGNTTRKLVSIELVPRKPAEPVRGVHVTSYGWADPDLRKGVLDLIDQGRITTVELDLKDEAGIVGFDAKLPLGHRIGSVKNVYDLRRTVELLHGKGVQVVGRLVAFRDPILAAAAWKDGHRDEVIQTPEGTPYAGYGGFTNFANPVVRRYNIDIAREAAAAGVDDVLYDYVRRPDGPRSSMVFPGLRGTAESSIVSFLAQTRTALRPYKTFLGASVFGVAATRPEEVAQDIPQMARTLDYVAPMVYPSHWGPGEYDVANPNAQPYDIVLRSLRDFRRDVRGTGARVVPWLQDFSLGVTYGPDEVRAQIRAARDAGISEWLLWDPVVTYTADALDRHARAAAPLPGSTFEPKPAARPTPAARARAGTPRSAGSGLPPNELGKVPVLMYHQIRADGGGDYDLTPGEFRAELGRLYREGYRPVQAVDLVRGTLDVPAGTSPVVLTFDDSTKEQFAYGARGTIKPNTALGIMLAFARTHPGFKPAGTFYPNREPFAGVAEGPAMLRYLASHGFELGDHTYDHLPFNQLDATGVQRQLVLGKRVITDAVPDASVKTMALPLGVIPTPATLAQHGSWGGESYSFDGVFLVGAEPSPSPFSTKFDSAAIPRIRTAPPAEEAEFGSTYWLDELKRHPNERYVSDGNPKTISFPASLRGELAGRYSSRARPLGG